MEPKPALRAKAGGRLVNASIRLSQKPHARDNLVDAFAPAPPADRLKRRIAHIFVIGPMFANGMLAELQMRGDVPVLKQGKPIPVPNVKTHSRPRPVMTLRP
jgi:hypothetical protein